MRSIYPTEAKTLVLDGAKVHLSPTGWLTLLQANVHVGAEPSKMSHIVQELDNPSAFGRYQLKVRYRVRALALEVQAAGRAFTTIELMRSISEAASEALTVEGVSSAFRLVGMFPLNPGVISWEWLSKGADAPVAPDMDIKRLTARMIPGARKDMARPALVNGTMSTAGRATVLTAPEILAEIASLEVAKDEKRAEAEASKRARDERAVEKAEKDAERERGQSALARRTGRLAIFVNCGGCWPWRQPMMLAGACQLEAWHRHQPPRSVAAWPLAVCVCAR